MPSRTGGAAAAGPEPGWRPGAQRARRLRFARVRKSETEYARALRKIARHVEDIVRGFAPADGVSWEPLALRQITDMLTQYARMLDPWAATQANRILSEVMRRDAVAWTAHGTEIGRGLRREIATTPLEPALSAMREEQIRLITSLPREAASRVHDLSVEGMTGGRRWEEIAKEIFDTGAVTRHRAALISRTETGRIATTVTKARAEHIGSAGYYWRTARDRDVRPRHQELEGQFIPWHSPPVASEPGEPEMRYHAGAGPNCRCFTEPLVAGDVPAPGTIFRRERNPAYLAALRAAGLS